MRRALPILSLLLAGATVALPQAAPEPPQPLTAGQAEALVDRALANELHAAQDSGHPMRYLLHKATPRLATTRAIYETKDGDVARLLTVNGSPLSPAAEQKEEARLQALVRDPARQRHRKLAEEADTARALKVLRLLPSAFVYQYAGPGQGANGPVERFAFRPNPEFSAPDLETEVLTAMSGELWVDPAQERVTRLAGHLDEDVDFGWGILGRLNHGGWIQIDQAEVAPGLWRTVRLQMAMTGRVVFRTRVFNVVQEESRFTAVPANVSYADAIAQLLTKEEARRQP